MNQDVKGQWTNALRSGKYVQGQAFLRNEREELCCLGVLSELAVEAGVIPAAQLGNIGAGGNYDTCYLYGEHKEPYYLCREVREWAGLPDGDPTVYLHGYDESDYGDTLSDINDNGETFDYIADVIEEHL